MTNTRAGKRPKLGDAAKTHPLTGGGLAGGGGDAATDDTAQNLEADADNRKRSAGGGGGGDPDKAKTDIEAVLAAGGTRIPGTGAGHGCLHDVVYPPDWKPDPNAGRYDPENPAKHYAFELDTFQRKSVEVMEAGESVMVAAHTSAGKTVVAEYAIAMALRDGQRVVYTSPLKALSNQKYRELRDEFEDVGLMTGDTTINTDASCLVMTTEVLRSMLYRGGEVMREVGWVIFDEIHYMRDPERGVVWEETVVLLPDAVKYVFLSATIPNAREFAEWIVRTHKQPCHLVYTDFRPTPLEHYIHPSGANGIYLSYDRDNKFRQDNFLTAINAIGPASDGYAAGRTAHRKANEDGGGGGGGSGGNTNDKNPANADIHKIIRMVVEKNYDPVIVFSFSKRECEELVGQLEKIDLLDEDEKKLVDTVYWASLDNLNEDDKRLPQVVNLLPVLRRGIGLHHSGLMPILKEAIEVLFQEGLLKVLIATETMSTGLNMPARCVVFTSPRKFDGSGYRWISSGEYVQMSGRAGRRGLDDRGLVILMMDERMDPAVAKDMLHGRSDPLNSAFHLTYSMILNLMRIEGGAAENLMKASFAQFQNDRNLPKLEATAARLAEERDAVVVDQGEAVAEYVNLRDTLAVLTSERRDILNLPAHSVPFLQPGRLVRVCVKDPRAVSAEAASAGEDGGAAARAAAEVDAEWGMIVKFERNGTDYVVDVLCNVADATAADGNVSRRGRGRYGIQIKPIVPPQLGGEGREGGSGAAADNNPGEPRVIQVPLSQVDRLSSVRLYLAKDLLSLEGRLRMQKSIAEAMRRFPDGVVPLLDPEEHMKVEGGNFRKLVRRIEALEGMLKRHSLTDDDRLPSLLEAFAKKRELALRCKVAKREAKAASGLILRDDLKNRRRVLRRMGHVSEDDVVQMKGRVACEMTTADELVATELIFNGTFKELEPVMCVALISALVWRESGPDINELKLSEESKEVHDRLRDTARLVGKQVAECKLDVDVNEYVDSFRPDLMDMSRQWATGTKFSEIMKLTTLFEGSVVRAIRRMEETMRQLATACRVIGEVELEKKFEECSTMVKRDIVFVDSLFL